MIHLWVWLMISGLSLPSLWLSYISLTRCSVVAYHNVRSQTHRANNFVVEGKFFSVSVSFPWIFTSLSSALLQLRYQTQITLNLQYKKRKKGIFPFFILDEQIIIRIIKNELVYAKFQWLCWSLPSRWLLQNLSAQNIWQIMKIRSLFTRCPFFAKQCICSS